MKISVITATYNSYPAIKDCIKSLANQKNVNLEHIVIDGGSTDHTLGVVANSSLDSIVVCEPDNGLYDALNKGINIASGDIIGLLHSDDFLASPNILSTIVKEFKKTNADGIYGDLVYVSKDTQNVIRLWKSNDFKPNSLRYGWMPAHPTLFLKREVYQKYGLFDLSFKISADYDYIQRIFQQNNLKFCYLPIVITQMRIGGASNKSLGNIKLKMQEDYKAIKQNMCGGWYTLLFKNIRKLNQFFAKKHRIVSNKNNHLLLND